MRILFPVLSHRSVYLTLQILMTTTPIPSPIVLAKTSRRVELAEGNYTEYGIIMR